MWGPLRHLTPCLHPCPVQIKPAIYVTYNGDYFDWPFIGERTYTLMHALALPSLV